MSDFTHTLPFTEDKLLLGILTELNRANETELYGYLKTAKLTVEDLGTSYYVDYAKTSRWNARGVNISFAVNPNLLNVLDNAKFKNIIDGIAERLIPTNVGFDIKEVVFIHDLSRDFDFDEEVDALANMDILNSEAIQVLSDEIKSKLKEEQPQLALDRLHTFSVRFFRELLQKYRIDFAKDDGLHTLLSKYRKHLETTGLVQSEMTMQIIKTNINILNNFNTVRNNKSYAHDNEILNKSESRLICSHIIALLKFIAEVDDIESLSF